MNEPPNTTPEASDANADTEVSLGQLLSPSEFAHECAQTRQRPNYTSWAVRMQLPDAAVKVLESEFVPVRTRLALFSSTNGPMYPIVVVQAGAMQIRALLSLSNPNTHEWFKEAVTMGRVRLAVDVTGTDQFAVIKAPFDAQPLSVAEDAIRQCVKLERDEAFLDKYQLAERLLKPGAVRSQIPGFQVQAVRLVIVVAGGEKLLGSMEPVAAGEVIH